MMVVKGRELDKLCSDLKTAGRFALDLEFIPERTYSPELCLVQVATDDNAYIIDPLYLKDLGALWQLIADPDIPVVLHAAEHDMVLMYAASGLVPHNILDTQLAAGFAGYGYPIGYGKLLNQLLGIQLSKTESFTDWMNRPLTQSQIEYALDDVRHLLPMYDCLREKLQELNRLGWAMEECKRYSLPDRYQRDRSNDFLRVKGASALSRRSLAILKCLVEWRDAEGYKLNKPPRSVVQDNILFELSRRPPKNPKEIERIRGVRSDFIRNYGDQVMQSIQQGQSLPEESLPSWPSCKAPPRRDALHVDVLYTLVKVLCYEMEVAPELVTTRDELQTLVRVFREGKLDISRHPILQGWRYELFGRLLLEVLAGSALRLNLNISGLPVQVEVEQQDR